MNGHQRWLYHGRKGKSQSFRAALQHAGRGLLLGFIFEANIRRHLFVLAGAVSLGVLLHITSRQWAALLIVAMVVVMVELINSAIEALADAVHPEYSEYIQRSKDLSAAAVLLASSMAFLVGLFIFLPPLSTLWLWLVNSM